MQPSSVNDVLIRVVGMSRSGNHAIIDWILSALPRSWCFLNCVEPKQDPWHTARPMDDGRRILSSASPPIGETVAKQLAWDYLVVSHEDTFLKPVFAEPAATLQASAVGGSRRRLDVLILRDPFNLFASRWRGRMGWVADHIASRIWKQHAKAFLSGRSGPNRPLIPISYNEWVADPQYRRAIARQLHMEPTSDIPPGVARCGGGSSFDGYGETGAAHRLRVFDRWRHYAHEPSFWRLFDEQTWQLSRRIFGETSAVSRPETGVAASIPAAGAAS